MASKTWNRKLVRSGGQVGEGVGVCVCVPWPPGTGSWKKTFRTLDSFVGFCGTRQDQACDGDRAAENNFSGPPKFCRLFCGTRRVRACDGDGMVEKNYSGPRLWDQVGSSMWQGQGAVQKTTFATMKSFFYCKPWHALLTARQWA